MREVKLPVFLFFLLVAFQSSAQSGLHADTMYYESGEVREIKTYKKRSMINHLVFDRAGKLIYQSPLLPDQKVPTFRFTSGRTYYDQKLTDTIVFGSNIPHLNFHFVLNGSTVGRIDGHTFIIKAWKPQPGTQKGKMTIKIYENMFDNSKVVVNKVVYVDIK